MPKLPIQRGEIYLAQLDPSYGHEQRGTRPVLVVSADGFNAITETPIVVPITTQGAFARTRGFAVSLDDAGTKTTGIIRCDQPRPIDLNARNARLLEKAPQAVVDQVLATVTAIFS